MTDTFTSLSTNSKRLYKKQKDINSEISSIYSSKSSVCSSTTNSNDWHRLLVGRLKPGFTRKYRMTIKDGNKFDKFPLASFEDSPVTLKSYNDESSIIDNHQIILTESDTSKQLDSSIENSIRRDNRFIKKSMSMSCRSEDHITSLKRRVRKQQMRHPPNQSSILQETTFQLPSTTDLLLMSYPQPTVAPRRYRPKNASCVVSLPPLMNATRAVPTHMHDIKLNLYGYQ